MQKTIKVNGMMCAHCEARVKKALEAINGVQNAQPDKDNGTVELTLDSTIADEAIKAAVTDAGYEFTE